MRFLPPIIQKNAARHFRRAALHAQIRLFFLPPAPGQPGEEALLIEHGNHRRNRDGQQHAHDAEELAENNDGQQRPNRGDTEGGAEQPGLDHIAVQSLQYHGEEQA